MPLNLAALLYAPGLPGARERAYPGSAELAAREWRLAVEAWMLGVVPVSTQVSDAAMTLERRLRDAFALPSSAPQIDQAFQVFGGQVALGMLPAYTAAPPPAPPGFAQAALQPHVRTRQEGVVRIATRLHHWAMTGSAVLVAPPYTPLMWT